MFIFTLSHIAFPGADDVEKEKDLVDILYDKDLHFLIFGILSYFVVNALTEFKIKYSKIAIITVIFCYIYAITDEYHQGYIAGRDVSWIDILFDMLGAIAGVGFYWLYDATVNNLKPIKDGKKLKA